MARSEGRAFSESDDITEVGLSNVQLEELSKELEIKNFRGVFMDDTLPDKIKNPECGIVNYQDSTEPGSHWVSYAILGGAPSGSHAVVAKFSCYFDSLGFPPTQNLLRYLKSAGNPILYNEDEVQKDDWSCGLYAMEFLRVMDSASDPYDAYYSFLHGGDVPEGTKEAPI